MKSLFILLLAFFPSMSFSQASLNIDLLPGEKVWSGVIKDGQKMPYEPGYRYDRYANNGGNQIQPLLLGNKGLWVWSEDPYTFEVQRDKIVISNAKGTIKYGHIGKSLADARKYVSSHFFPASGKCPVKCCSQNRSTIPGSN